MKQLMIFVLSIFCATGVAMAQGSFQGIGYEPGYGSIAYVASADGSFVVGWAGQAGHLAGETEQIRWTEAGGMMFLGDLPGGPLRSFAKGVSDDGMVVAGEGRYDALSLEVEATRWTSGTGMVGLGFLPGGTYSTGEGISADGSVVVGTSQSTERSRQAFRWTESGGMQGLGGPSASTNSFAFNVTPDGGTVVGNGVFGTLPEAAYWTEGGGWTSIGKLPGGLPYLGAFATDVSADGSVIVGNSSSTLVPYSYEAFRWTASEGMLGLGLLLPHHDLSTTTGLSGDGQIVVGVSGPYSGTDRRPYIWDETNGMRDLRVVFEDDFGMDLTGWTLVEVLGISRDGTTFVGYGDNPQGVTEGWIATIPEPLVLPLDIKPGSCPNPLNVKAIGKLPVAILGTEAFDVMNIDPMSITIARADGVMGSAGVNVKPNGLLHVSYEDVGTPYDGDPCGCHEMGGDGYMDLTIKFNTQDLVSALALDTLANDTEMELVVSGTFLNGMSFEAGAEFEARDCILIKGNNNVVLDK